MKKWLSVVTVVITFSLPAMADVDCSSVTVCTLDRGDGLCHPAVLFNVVADQTVTGTFSACDDDQCLGMCSDPQSFAFDLMAGPSGVFLTSFLYHLVDTMGHRRLRPCLRGASLRHAELSDGRGGIPAGNCRQPIVSPSPVLSPLPSLYGQRALLWMRMMFGSGALSVLLLAAAAQAAPEPVWKFDAGG